MNAVLLNKIVKAEALRLGFSACGVSPAAPVDARHAARFRQWLSEGQHADMHYMEGHQDMRLDPRLLVEGVRSIVSVALGYMPVRQAAGISLYAQGQDYHDILRQRLAQLMTAIGGTGRAFVDTPPVLERYWAWRGGLGWIGRHHQLIIPHAGSAFFLGELFLLEAVDAYDSPLPGSCGDCMRCIQACPSGALTAESLDARRCLSYLTIEHRGSLPFGTRLPDNFYGCDRCLLACPHGHAAAPCGEAEFQPSAALLAMKREDWQSLTREQYQALFRGSAIKRAKYEGLLRNIAAWDGNDCKEQITADPCEGR